jgi:hypothetical protein
VLDDGALGRSVIKYLLVDFPSPASGSSASWGPVSLHEDMLELIETRAVLVKLGLHLPDLRKLRGLIITLRKWWIDRVWRRVFSNLDRAAIPTRGWRNSHGQGIRRVVA